MTTNPVKQWMRNDYMQNKCSHREYYAQFVTEPIRRLVIRRFGIEKLSRCLKTDEHINNIPLGQWDGIAWELPELSLRLLLKDCGDGWSSCAAVCILKEAAKQAVEMKLKLETTQPQQTLSPSDMVAMDQQIFDAIRQGRWFEWPAPANTTDLMDPETAGAILDQADS